jgi:NAD(P)-dependent dehydrogenase (short-subunit alcohol dehydrogenase family)
MFDVNGKRAIITGGAQGFGREFGIRLAGSGCRICLADLDEVKGEETKKEIQRRFNLKDDRCLKIFRNFILTFLFIKYSILTRIGLIILVVQSFN